jgi:hypothetical protein
VDADRVQCSTNADCTNRGDQFANTECVASVCVALETTPDASVDHPSGHPDAGGGSGGGDAGGGIDDSVWTCLDRPPPVVTAPGPFHVTFQLSNPLAPTEIPAGVAVQLCRKLDPECTDPLATTMSDDKGALAFDVDKAFTGFALFTHKTYMTGLYFFNPPVNNDLEAVAVQLFTPSTVGTLVGLLHTTQQADRGIMLLNVVNCNGANAPGVQFESDGPLLGAIPFYSQGGIPNSLATVTDTAGYAGYVNASPGSFGVKGVVVGTKREVPLISLFVRAGAITYSKLVPIGH